MLSSCSLRTPSFQIQFGQFKGFVTIDHFHRTLGHGRNATI